MQQSILTADEIENGVELTNLILIKDTIYYGRLDLFQEPVKFFVEAYREGIVTKITEVTDFEA